MQTINCKNCNIPVIILATGSKILKNSKIEVYCENCKNTNDYNNYKNYDLPEGFEALFNFKK